MDTAKRPDRESGRAPRQFLRYVEEHAIQLRQQVGLGIQGPLDPVILQGPLGIVIANPVLLMGMSDEDRLKLQGIDARTWSGGGQPLPDGRTLVTLNPNMTKERAAVTIMEEVAHCHFAHTPTALVVEPTGLEVRQYDQVAEDEAYWTAAAALLPSCVVAKAIWKAVPGECIARDYGVSIELVEFRIKTLRFWPFYLDRRRAA